MNGNLHMLKGLFDLFIFYLIVVICIPLLILDCCVTSHLGDSHSL